MGVELRELVAGLRSELVAAIADGEDAPLRFGLGPIQIELTITVEKRNSTGGKIRFWVVDASADAEQSTSGLQRILLTLEPRLKDRPNEPAEMS
jgi:hypothetical protein